MAPFFGEGEALLAVIYIFPANYLNSYVTRLRRMKRNVDLEEWIDMQRAFWKFCGILTLVLIGPYFGGSAIAILVRI